MQIGFIGLGNMGAPMARNLIKAGHALVVYNRTRSRAEEVESAGARVATTAGEAAAAVEVVITMVADDPALEDVVFANGGVLDSLPVGSLHVGMSTISVALGKRLAAAHHKKKQHYISAPVFGRPEAAATAKLFVVAGGDPRQIERCRPIFQAVGQKTFVAGEDPAAANTIKVAGNFLITAVIESLAEAFTLGRKSGVDPKTFLEILTGSLFNAPVYRTYGAMVAENRYQPVGFKMRLGLKDNRLVLAAAEQAGVPMPMANLVHDRFVSALARGLGEADWCAIAQLAASDAGVAI
jgi:3-hydroxyisobutyrate dehydrogenase-like beta-hydroxyacid dehydrogenase